MSYHCLNVCDVCSKSERGFCGGIHGWSYVRVAYLNIGGTHKVGLAGPYENTGQEEKAFCSQACLILAINRMYDPTWTA